MIDIKPAIPWEIKHLLKKSEKDIELLIENSCDPIRKAALSVFKAGGKRLRPLLVLLSGAPAKNQEDLCLAAASVELLHIGSLIHDDIVDEAPLRRGKKTIHNMFNRLVAVSTGDNLFAIAFMSIAGCNNQRALELLSKAADCMSNGQLKELRFKEQKKINISDYIDMVYNKTAALFESSCGIGSLISGYENTGHLMKYGKNLGMAFQLADDLIDLTGDHETIGKAIGNDIRQKTMTLPIIFALESGLSRVTFDSIDENSPEEEVNCIVRLIKETKAVENVVQMIDKYTEEAKNTAREADCEMSELMIEIAGCLAKRVD